MNVKKLLNTEVINYYINKKEHYPISDSFIKKYQQNSEGSYSYITYAKDTLHMVDKNKCEPNQKWHLLESYFLQKIKENGIEYLSKETTCNRLLCPELLLWMAEAADVDLEVIIIANREAQREIQRSLKGNPNAPYSVNATRAMNKYLMERYNKTLWDFIKEKIDESIEIL